VKGFDIGAYLSAKEARRMDTFIHYGMAAGIQAFRDSGLEVTEANAERIGVNIGSGIGGLPMIEERTTISSAGGPRKISPFFIPGTIINMISGNLSIMFGLKGPNIAVVTACTTGLHAIGQRAHDRVRRCRRDGLRWCRIHHFAAGVGGFASAKALSTRNDDPPPPAARGTRTATASCWAKAPA
jgi:3-oxoacyl-[acyl-carrier-protein] synthase II